MELTNSNLYKPVIINQIIEEIKEFKTFVFEEGHAIKYQAGQYLTLVHFANKEEIRRSYSITSSPELNEPLSIGVKRIENGFFSRELVDHARPGDLLLTIGAGGFFILPREIDEYEQIFFFAAGSGITPIYSLLKTVLYNHPGIPVVLIYSCPSPDRTIFYESLVQLKEKFISNFQLLFLFSNSVDLVKAHLHRDLMEELLNEFIKSTNDRILFYICGPEPYMRLCTYVLQEKQMPKENIKKENFLIQRLAVPKPMPPDKGSHVAHIHISGLNYQVEVHYPDSILKAAKKAGISLPYSCETGRCGNCVAKCLSGKVWLSYNEVLTDRDLNKGLTLTCVGHPVDGDVVIEI